MASLKSWLGKSSFLSVFMSFKREKVKETRIKLIYDADRAARDVLQAFYKNKIMKLSVYERVILAQIAYCLDLPNRECYYSQAQFSHITEISRMQFYRAIKRLKELDLIETYYIKRRRTPNYRFGATLLLCGN